MIYFFEATPDPPWKQGNPETRHRSQVTGLATSVGNPAGKLAADAAICTECPSCAGRSTPDSPDLLAPAPRPWRVCLVAGMSAGTEGAAQDGW
jgi:hypothetical protein